MAVFVLDTDMVTLLAKGDARVSAEIQSRSVSEIAVTVITVEETLTGWYTVIRRANSAEKLSRAYDRLARATMLLGSFQVISFDLASIDVYESLLLKKLNVRANDLRIAAITMNDGATLVTRNRRDFGRVPNLNVVDWSV